MQFIRLNKLICNISLNKKLHIVKIKIKLQLDVFCFDFLLSIL